MAELNHYLGRSYPRIDDAYRRALAGNNIKEYDFFISFKYQNGNRCIFFSNDGARPGKTIHPDDYIDIDFHIWAGDDTTELNGVFRHYSYSGPAKYLIDNGEFYISYEKLIVGLDAASKLNMDYQVGAEIDHIEMKVYSPDSDRLVIPVSEATSRYRGAYYIDPQRGARITLASHRGRSYLALNPTIPAFGTAGADLSKYAEWYFEVPNTPRSSGTVETDHGGKVTMTIRLRDGKSIVRNFDANIYDLISENMKLYGGSQPARDFIYPAGEQNHHIRRVVLGPKEFKNHHPLSDLNGNQINPIDIRVIEFQFLVYQQSDLVRYHSILYPQLQIPVWDEGNFADVPMNNRRLVFSSYYIDPIKKNQVSGEFVLGNDTPVSRQLRYNLNSVIDNRYLTTVRNAPIRKNGSGDLIIDRQEMNSDYIVSKTRVNVSKGLYFEVLGHDGAIVSAGNGNDGRTQLIRRSYDDSTFPTGRLYTDRVLSSPGYAYITKNDRLYLIFNHDLMSNMDVALYAKFADGKTVLLRRVGNLYYSAYETYEMVYPEGVSYETIASNIDRETDYVTFYRVTKRQPNDGGGLFRTKIRLHRVGRSVEGGQIRGFLHGRSIFARLTVVKVMNNRVKLSIRNYLDNTDEITESIQELITFNKSGITSATYDQISPDGPTFIVPKSAFTYDPASGYYELNAALYKRRTESLSTASRLLLVSISDKLVVERRSVDDYPGVRYIQIGQDKTIVGFGNSWYDRPSISKQPEPGYLKYTAEDGTTATSMQTLDSSSPGTYYYSNNESSRGVFPKEAADGSVTFTLSWDNGIDLADNTVKLYKDPHIPGLYSIRPTYEYTNICHHGHVANPGGSHWFALPGRLVETESLGTNVDYTDRRTTLMDDASRLSPSDNFVGDYWEKGRLVLLDSSISFNGKSKTGTAMSVGVKSQLSNKPYNYYYGNSFLKNNTAFNINPTSTNVSVDYGEEDKLPNINQDFTTNCGYNNESRELSDWTISRVYYDHKKVLLFGPEDSSYSRVNYRGARRNFTPGGIAPAAGGIATLVNGGTLRAQSGTTSLFINAPQCAVIEGDIIVDATGNNSEIPLELYKNDTLIVGVLIMRGRILIKGSNHPNPLIGIKNPTLVVNETHWDFDQLFTSISDVIPPGSYRLVGAYLLGGNSIIFVEDTNGHGIPREIASLSGVTTIGIGRTSLSSKPVFAIAGNIYSATVPRTSYFHFENINTGDFLSNISHYLVQETLRFGFNGGESISYPHYLTMSMSSDINGGSYPEYSHRQGYENHRLYVYDLTGKFTYSRSELYKYRKEYAWFYNTGTIDGFRNFIKKTMRNDDNRELINAKRIIVTYLNTISGPTYKMANSVDEALMLIPWRNDVDIKATLYAFD